MRDRDISVVIAVPHVDTGRDVLQAKIPILGKQGKVLRRRAGAGGRSTPVGIDVGRSHLRSAHYLEVRARGLTGGGSHRDLRPPTKDRNAQRKKRIDEILGLSRQSCDQPVEEHHSLIGPRFGQRAHSADDADASHATRQEPGAGRGVRSSSGDPDHRERGDVQVIGQAGDVGCPVGQSTSPLIPAAAETWAVHRDESDSRGIDRTLVERHLETRPGRAMEDEDGRTLRVTTLQPGQLAAVGQVNCPCLTHSSRPYRLQHPESLWGRSADEALATY